MSSLTPAAGVTDRADGSITVTVVIPAFNAAGTVADAIESVRRQSDIDVEIICVNDESHDSTGAVLSMFAAEGLIRYFDHANRRGASAARNRGLREAQGAFVRFLDADDTLVPGTLQRQAKIMQSSGAEVVAGAYEHIDISGRRSTCYPDEDPWAGLLASRLGRTSSNLFRTAVLRAVGGWNTRQRSSQEYDLMFRLMRSGARVALDRAVGARLYATSGSISLSDEQGNARRFIRLRREIMSYLEESGLITGHRRACFESACRQARSALSSPGRQ